MIVHVYPSATLHWRKERVLPMPVRYDIPPEDYQHLRNVLATLADGWRNRAEARNLQPEIMDLMMTCYCQGVIDNVR